MRSHLKILLAAAVVFFALTSWFGRPAGGLYGSPDETANAFWAGRVTEAEPLGIRDQLVGEARGAIHPRSMAVRGDLLLPGSFPGLFFLYGAVRALVPMPLWMMTPLVTAVAGLLFYALLRRLFPEGRTAFFAAALFYLHPAIFYYSARGLFHNVLLVDLLIVSASFLVLRPFSAASWGKELLDDFSAGLTFGFAVVVRASELPWMLLAAAIFLVPGLVARAPKGGRRWRRLAAAAVGAAGPILLMLYFNAAAYGSPLSTGYAPQPASAPVSAPATTAPAAPAETDILPFGFHPRLMLAHGWAYGVAIFWWFSIAALAGLGLFVRRWKGRRPDQRRYLAAAALVAGWLVLLYGSWYFRDHYDPTKVTIGTSYVRYFLPFYVLLLPFAGLALDAVAARFPRRGILASGLLVVVIAVLSLNLAVRVGDESLLAAGKVLRDNVWKRSVLLSWLPEDAVLITARFDKVVFPEIVRIVPLIDDASLEAIADLADVVPMYHYGPDLSEPELAALKDRLWEHDLLIVEDGKPIPGETLYRVLHWVPDDETGHDHE